jgi:hypothetical protein
MTNTSTHLHEIGLKHRLDKAYEHEYTLDFYPAHLDRIRDSADLVIEIGIWNGGSLRMWGEYFPSARLIGADIDLSKIDAPIPRCNLRYLDQSKPTDLKTAFEDIAVGSVDLIIEDGMHTARCQQTCFGVMFDYVKPGGIYIIEDLQTSLVWPIELKERVTTLDLVQALQASGELDSDYIPKGTAERLENDIGEIFIYTRTPDYEKSVAAVIYKRQMG